MKFEAPGNVLLGARQTGLSLPSVANVSQVDDGDAVVFDGYRFRNAPTFTTPFPSTKRRTRYPIGNLCFDSQFQVIRVGD